MFFVFNMFNLVINVIFDGMKIKLINWMKKLLIFVICLSLIILNVNSKYSRIILINGVGIGNVG